MPQPLSRLVLAALMVAGSAFPALAGADRAKAHVAAIEAGKVEALAASYADASVLDWVGGPLNGTYVGREAIAAVWQKFAAAQGPLTAKVTNLQENANPAGATVTVDIVFSGKNTIPVRHVSTWRGEVLSSEIWQIAPELAGK